MENQWKETKNIKEKEITQRRKEKWQSERKILFKKYKKKYAEKFEEKKKWSPYGIIKV